MAIEQVPLKFLTTVVSRGTAPNYSDDGAIRVVGQASNQSSGIDWSATRLHAFDGLASRLKGYLRSQDILVNSTGTGTLGRVGYFTAGPDDRPCIADGHVTVVRADSTVIDPRYLFYHLSSRHFYDYLYAALVVGATNQIELNREKLMGVPINVPSIVEQRRIADFLDAETVRIDQIVELRSQQRRLLDRRTQAVADQIFANFKRARKTRLKFLLRQRPRYGVLVPEFVDDGIPFIRVNDLLDLYGRSTDLPRISLGQSRQYSRTVIQKDDVLLSVVGTVGRAAIAPRELAGANVARAVCSLRVRPHVLPELALAWTATSGFKRQTRLATGTDTAQPTLGMEDLANFELLWPTDHDEQIGGVNAFRAASATIRDADQLLDRQESVVRERRQALITAAVTGLLDVTTARGADVP